MNFEIFYGILLVISHSLISFYESGTVLGMQNKTDTTHNHQICFHRAVSQIDKENRVKWISECFVNKLPSAFKICMSRETIMLSNTFAHQGLANVNFSSILHTPLWKTLWQGPPLISHLLASRPSCNPLPLSAGRTCDLLPTEYDNGDELDLQWLCYVT